MARALRWLTLLGLLGGAAVLLLTAPDARPLRAFLPHDVHAVELVRLDALAQPDEEYRFDVDPDGRPVLLVEGSSFVRCVGEGEAAPDAIRAGPRGTLHDLAWMDDGALLVVNGRALVEVTTDGAQHVQELPEFAMRIRPASEGRCYVFGGHTGDGENLYLYRKGGDVLHLLRAEGEIGAVAGDGDFTFVAVGHSIYLLAPEAPWTFVARAQRPIRSLALGPDASLFYATATSVGVCVGPGRRFEFLRDRGGAIRIRGETLHVLSPSTGVMRLSPVASLVRMAAEAEDA
ncbi:MAG: hypothetical protein QNJ98_01380 [Planctomycetota bacterium]|nr:hypothetical protein [Planctomycetota bacterium]